MFGAEGKWPLRLQIPDQASVYLKFIKLLRNYKILVLYLAHFSIATLYQECWKQAFDWGNLVAQGRFCTRDNGSARANEHSEQLVTPILSAATFAFLLSF